ncbi:hypothetical protein ncot_19080 [Nocardioides sp. JQ2195]|uniref:hypothetical protein n=1 Tax=Nocardioides sp. JQ2195 TaxID=2592334 RepID=UPI00143E8D51|nr:hypothetical protein [Nocardioides sp. JQ2195]QIX28459.1 hypothetical protein ncot_19080 [Nocardioides sp. JQ2195]
MNAATRLATYVAGLVVVLAGGWLVGDRTGLGDVEQEPASHSTHGDDHGDSHGDRTDPTIGLPGGLQVSQDGHTLEIVDSGFAPGKQEISFRIVGPDGEPVTSFERAHEKLLHLIAVRRDFSGFQHVHPVLDADDGTWSVDLDLDAGAWRIFADFVPTGGAGLTLGADLLVSGPVDRAKPDQQALPRSTHTDRVDGFTVELDGELVAGEHAMLELEITKDGEPVTDLQPYLGAYGHLVALREGDLAYLHVHPSGEPGDGSTEPGPSIEFGAEVPSVGRYHLFLDFKVDGQVHTAQLALDTHDHDH